MVERKNSTPQVYSTYGAYSTYIQMVHTYMQCIQYVQYIWCLVKTYSMYVCMCGVFGTCVRMYYYGVYLHYMLYTCDICSIVCTVHFVHKVIVERALDIFTVPITRASILYVSTYEHACAVYCTYKYTYCMHCM